MADTLNERLPLFSSILAIRIYSRSDSAYKLGCIEPDRIFFYYKLLAGARYYSFSRALGRLIPKPMTTVIKRKAIPFFFVKFFSPELL